MRRLLTVLVALLAALLPSACAVGGSDDRTLGDVVREAIAAAKEAREAATGTTGGTGAPGGTGDAPSIGTSGGRTEFEYAEFQGKTEGVLTLLQSYWSETLPALGGRYSDPQGGYRYYRSDEGGGPSCAGQAAPAKNAFYCPAGDFIAWDETGLLIPYYVQGGDFAAAFVLAHEFGHAMQVRLPRQETQGILRELQADCFAGAWAQGMSQAGKLEAGDLDEATLAVISARDVPGTPWTDPAAHGSGFQRTRAFGDGFEGGPAECYPAPADDWIIEA